MTRIFAIIGALCLSSALVIILATNSVLLWQSILWSL